MLIPFNSVLLFKRWFEGELIWAGKHEDSQGVFFTLVLRLCFFLGVHGQTCWNGATCSALGEPGTIKF